MPYKDPKLSIFMPAFPTTKDTTTDEMAKIAHDLSPIYMVTSSFPPTLLIHGDADQLVPVQQSKDMNDALQKAGVKHNLIIVPGGGHDGKTIGGGLAGAIKWFQDNLGS
jgi:dipeptidyl aminopeptidase/acylaminoacyl peptidase